MSQWGFYFNQSRCLGCKTCILACKNWNEERRGDAAVNAVTIESMTSHMVEEGAYEYGSNYIDSQGYTNYADFRKNYMKEKWRRVESFESGKTLRNKNTHIFSSDFDRRYISISCNHCDTPACRDACPTAAIYKEESIGSVLVDSSACISCGKCRQACPWDVPQYYDDNFAKYNINDPARPRMTKCTFCADRIKEGLKPACVAACWNRALDAGPMDELEARYPSAVRVLPEFSDGGTGPNILFKSK
jgi:anaerobic dimethyl sulfoxide reductase subunit B (iron-sulfur subunit)